MLYSKDLVLNKLYHPCSVFERKVLEKAYPYEEVLHNQKYERLEITNAGEDSVAPRFHYV